VGLVGGVMVQVVERRRQHTPAVLPEGMVAERGTLPHPSCTAMRKLRNRNARVWHEATENGP
jgi:hypothetical protein